MQAFLGDRAVFHRLGQCHRRIDLYLPGVAHQQQIHAGLHRPNTGDGRGNGPGQCAHLHAVADDGALEAVFPPKVIVQQLMAQRAGLIIDGGIDLVAGHHGADLGCHCHPGG